MKRLLKICLWMFVLTMASGATAQCTSQTPNLGLYTPAYNTPMWNVCLNDNFNTLDSYLSGALGLPANLVVNGNLTVLGSVTCGSGCNGGGGGGNLTGSGSVTQLAVWTGTTNLAGYHNLFTDTSGNLTSNSLTTGNLFATTLTITAGGPGIIQIGNGGSYIALQSTYPCNSTNQNSIAVVNDSNTATWGASVSGGGSTKALVFCDGTNWTVAAI